MLLSSIKANVRLWISPSFSGVQCKGLAFQNIQWTPWRCSAHVKMRESEVSSSRITGKAKYFQFQGEAVQANLCKYMFF